MQLTNVRKHTHLNVTESSVTLKLSQDKVFVTSLGGAYNVCLQWELNTWCFHTGFLSELVN